MSAYVWRSVGDDHEPRQFKVWAPKAVAMIGKLPDTLEDRALVVPLRRKQAGETVDRFRADRINDFLPLRRKAARWADDVLSRLRDMDPDVPAELNDRAQDNARAICAIADAAGGVWPSTIRAALIGTAEQSDDEPQSAGVLLLRDVAEIFEKRASLRIGSTELCDALCELEESPWGDWRRGSPITTRGIAKLLKPFGITPLRDMTQRYYGRADFVDAFKRYLSDGLKIGVTSGTSVMPFPSVTEKSSKNNDLTLDDACVAYSDPDENKCHSDDWEGEL